MELTFQKSQNRAGVFLAKGFGQMGYVLTLNPDKTFSVKRGNKTVATGIKGMTAAQNKAQAAEDGYDAPETEEEEEEEEGMQPTKTKTKTGTTAGTKTVAGKATGTGNGTKAVTPKKVKTFPDFETWAQENVPAKTRKETADVYAKRLQVAKMTHGRERAKYNKANDIETAGTASGTKTVTPKKEKIEKPEPRSKDELYGEPWNEWGEVPTAIEYAVAQLNNAIASVDFQYIHGLMHPRSTVANDMYLKAVERLYISEERLYHLCKTRGESLPDGVTFRYFNAADLGRGVFIGSEDTDVTDGYTIAGGGELRKRTYTGEDVTLPVKIKTVPAKTVTGTAGKGTAGTRRK